MADADKMQISHGHGFRGLKMYAKGWIMMDGICSSCCLHTTTARRSGRLPVFPRRRVSAMLYVKVVHVVPVVKSEGLWALQTPAQMTRETGGSQLRLVRVSSFHL